MSRAADPHSLLGLLDRAAEATMVVAGDLVLDAWLTGRSKRLCREGPVPVVEIERESYAAGGAGNAAANAAALGAEVRMIGAVGDDAEGEILLDVLANRGVNVSGVLRLRGRRTPTKRRLVCDGQLLARFDTQPTGSPLPEHAERRVAEALGSPGDAVATLVSDYHLGSLSPTARRRLRRRGDTSSLLVVDAHRLEIWAPVEPDAVTPNWDEAVRLLPGSPNEAKRPEAIEAARSSLLSATGAALVAVTLDEDGAVLLESGRPSHRAYARRVAAPRNTGTGDSFAAAFTLALATGADPTAALEFGVVVSGAVATQPGTAVCDRGALRQELLGPAGVVVNPAELQRLINEHRSTGHRIVFTNGCFDVLHRGHVAYLNEAKRLGDILVVGLNDDASVRRLKGAGRPVNEASDRAAVLAALSCVDHVTTFSEDSPRSLLRVVRPDIYVKGGDYTEEELPEAPLVRDLGGEVRILGYLADHSTSRIVSRIRGGAQTGTGA